MTAGRARRGLRWLRLAVHAAHGALILRFVYPRVDASQRRRYLRWWSEKLVRIVGVTLRVEGEVPAAGERRSMLAANHVSWLDIFAVNAAWPTRFVAKSEIRDWPLAGWIAERAGTLFIRRERRADVGRIHDRLHEVLEQRDCVGLFPEGTTTEGDTLLKFHTSLFEPAVANRAHLHPVAIRYERRDGTLAREIAYVGELSFMQSMALVIAQRGVVARVTFGPAIDCAQVTQRREAAHLARTRIANLLALSLADNPPGIPAGLRASPP